MSAPNSHKALSDLVAWCDKNDWGCVPKKLEAACRAAIAQSNGPEGVVVPKEPTPEMLKAGLSFLHIDEHEPALLGAYRAMLAAAPQSAGAERGIEVVRHSSPRPRGVSQ